MKSILNSPIKKKQCLLIIVDCVIIFTAILLSYSFRIGIYEQKELLLIGERLSWLVFPAVIIQIMTFYVFELYNIEKRFLKLRGFLTIILSVGLAVGLLTGLSYFFPRYKLGRVVLAAYIPIVVFGLFFWRLSYFKAIHKKAGNNNLLLIGGKEECRLLVKELRKCPVKEYNIVGIMSEVENNQLDILPEVPIIDKNRDIERLVKDINIKTILISSNSISSGDFVRSALKLKFKGIDIYDAATFYKNLTGKVPIFHIKDFWLLFLGGIGPFNRPFYKKLKRLMDIFLASCLLFLTSPLFILFALAIKLNSKGPIFFKQERLGFNQKPFTLIKFRTMVEDAEAKTGPIRARKNDPRVTKIGKFLRKTRLDEIPQFINVLRGDMSFVGPRPIRKYFASKYSKKIPYYTLRFTVKPGLTGWTQTRFGYSETDEDQGEKFQYDLFYIQEASLFLDLLIVLKTIQALLFRPSQ